MVEPHKPAMPMVWVKDKEGNTYICPKESLQDPKNFSDEELKECIDESDKPWND